MSGPEWKDTSSWSRSDSEEVRKTPKAWSLHLKKSDTELTLHRHTHSPGTWFVTCRKIGLDTRQLSSLDAEDAKDEAIAVARQKVDSLNKELAAMLGEL